MLHEVIPVTIATAAGPAVNHLLSDESFLHKGISVCHLLMFLLCLYDIYVYKHTAQCFCVSCSLKMI